MDTIKWFKKHSKHLHRSFKADDPEARKRVESVLSSTDRVSLQRVQHVIAVEAGFGNWKELLDASETERVQAVSLISQGVRYLNEVDLGDDTDVVWDLPEGKATVNIPDEMRGAAAALAEIDDPVGYRSFGWRIARNIPDFIEDLGPQNDGTEEAMALAVSELRDLHYEDDDGHLEWLSNHLPELLELAPDHQHYEVARGFVQFIEIEGGLDLPG